MLHAEHVAGEVTGHEADAAGDRHRGIGGHPRLAGADLSGDDRAERRELRRRVRAGDSHVLGRQDPVGAGEVVAGVVVQGADD